MPPAHCVLYSSCRLNSAHRWCFLKLLSGAMKLPSLKVAKRAMPTSMPTARLLVGQGG
jgi:hypothetical protein